jgi:hypothetical protein
MAWLSFRFSAPPPIFFLMLTLLRRSRAMALAMMLLAPGISGSAVQWLHACPVQAASVADHQHGQAPADADQSHSCQCIGSCNPAGAASHARSITVAVAVIQPDHHVVPPSGVSFVPVGTPSDLLPPATAPPA